MFNILGINYSNFSQFFLKIFFPRLMRLKDILQEKVKSKNKKLQVKKEENKKLLDTCTFKIMEINKIENKLMREKDKVEWYESLDRIIKIMELEKELGKARRENRNLLDRCHESVPLDQLFSVIKIQWLNFHISKLNNHSTNPNCTDNDGEHELLDEERKKEW